MGMAVTAYAASPTETKTTTHYGTLTGSVSGTKARVKALTSITKNPDNAYLTIKLDALNTLGVVQGTTGQRKSPTGIYEYDLDWTNLNSNCNYINGAHGVQGGTKYKADVVYTNTSM